MKRHVYDNAVIEIANNSRSFSLSKSVKPGTCVGVKVIPITDISNLSDVLNTNVSDGSNTLLGATDIRDFIPIGGDYVGGFKPCNFNTKNMTLTIDAISPSNLTADFKAQFIFMIEENCNN